jgi:dolichol-phosphate mannosyltransferase
MPDDVIAAAPAISVVVPTYRERENLDELVTRVSDTLDRLELLYEIIVVDDNSRDGTDDEIARLRSDGRSVRLIERQGERGLSSAVLRGFSEARGDYLVCMDADLSHPPEALPELLAAVRTPGVEMAVGSRYVPGASTDEQWGAFRRWNSRIATLLARPFTRLKDPMAGFFAVPRDVFRRTTAWDPLGYKIALEILVKAGCRNVHETPIHFANRRRGQSKLSFREQLNYLRHLVRLATFKWARRRRSQVSGNSFWQLVSRAHSGDNSPGVHAGNQAPQTLPAEQHGVGSIRVEPRPRQSAD